MPREGRRGTPTSGRRPSGINGEPRNRTLGMRVAEAEENILYEMCRSRGYKPDTGGLREMLLDMATENAATAA